MLKQHDNQVVIWIETPEAFAADLKISRAGATLVGRPRMKLERVQAALLSDSLGAQDALCRQLWSAIRRHNAVNRRYAQNQPAWPGRIEFGEIRSQLHRAYLEFARQYGEDPDEPRDLVDPRLLH